VRGGQAVKVSARSSLVVDGDVTLTSLDLDGALAIIAADGVHVDVRECVVKNKGWSFERLGEEEAAALPEAIAIRGYRVHKAEGVEVRVTEPGRYCLTGAGELQRVE